MADRRSWSERAQAAIRWAGLQAVCPAHFQAYTLAPLLPLPPCRSPAAPPRPCSTGTCSLSESHPGLWEFPMHNIQDATGATVASMDPLGDPLELFTRGFDQRYNG